MKNFMTICSFAAFEFLTVVLILIGLQAQAESVSRNFHIRDTKRAELTLEDLRKRFQLSTQVVVSDATGKMLYTTNLGRAYNFSKDGDLTVFEMSREPGLPDLAVKMTFKLADDGRLALHLQQYASMQADSKGRDPKVGKLIREEKFVIKDFAPVDWLAFNSEGKRVVLRMTPQLAEREDDPIDVQAAALAFKDAVVFDSKGTLWARTDGALEGRYLAVRSHAGSLAISFVPFKGAKEIGVALGNQLTLGGPDIKVYVRSASPVVMGSRPAKVYGMIDLQKRTEKPMSVHVQSGDKEKEFLRDL